LNDNVSQEGLKKKRFTALIPKLIALFLLGIFCYNLLGWGVPNEEKVKMEQYLKEKYGKEFVVEKVRYSRPYLGAPKEIRGIAYPTDDKTLAFTVAETFVNGKWIPGGMYSEPYLQMIWERQTNEKVKKVIGSNSVKTVVITPFFEIEKNLNGNTLSIDEVLNLYKNQISLRIYCGLFSKPEDNKLTDSELNELYSIINTLKDKRFKDISMEIRYFNEEYKRKVEKESEKLLTAQTSNYRELKLKNIILNRIMIYDINNIEEPGDILNYVLP
jgi:hypothetical protein